MSTTLCNGQMAWTQANCPIKASAGINRLSLWRILLSIIIINHRTSRLGFDGVESVKRHPFFKNEQWTFPDIRKSVPPLVFEMSSDDDTRNFDEVSEQGRTKCSVTKSTEHLQYSGNATEVLPNCGSFAGNCE